MKAKPVTTFEIEMSRDEGLLIYEALISKINGNSLNDKEIIICEQMITELGSLLNVDG